MKTRSDPKSQQQRRLSAALRENLKRRKTQAKARAAAERSANKADEPHDSAGIPEDKETEPR